MTKREKRMKPHGPTELLVVEAEQFPNAVIVELWHANKKGKREFLDSRRYEVVEPTIEATGEPATLAPLS